MAQNEMQSWFTSTAKPQNISPNEILQIAGAEVRSAQVNNLTQLVEFDFGRDAVADVTQAGQDLVLTLKDGRVIRISDYFSHTTEAGSQIPLDFAEDAIGIYGDLGNTVGANLGGLLVSSGALLGIGALVSGESGSGGLTPPPAPTETVAVNPDGTLSVTGTGEPGAEVTVTFPDGTTGTATVAPDGTFGPVTSAAAQSSSDVATIQTDANGNVSAPAADVSPPLAPTETVAVNPDGTLSVTGTGEPGAEVTVTFPDGTTGTATVAPDGTFGPVTSAAAQSSSDVATIQTDANGNVSAPAADVSPPLAPTETVAVNPDGTLSVTGTGEPGAEVTVTFPDGTTGTATVAPDGTFGPVTSAAAQSSSDVATIQTDANGNVSAPAADVSPPLAPTINQRVTDQANTISGTGEPGEVVDVMDSGGTTIGTVTVASDGTWSLVTENPILDGETLTATQQDAAGNTSTSVSQTTFIDTDGDGIANITDTDDDGDNVPDSSEDDINSALNVVTSIVAATAGGASATAGFVVTETSDDTQLSFTATAPRQTATSGGLGTISTVTFNVDLAPGEQLTNSTLTVDITGGFDDGIIMQVNDVTIVDFNYDDYRNNATVNDRFDLDNGGDWRPWIGEGNPNVIIDFQTGQVEIMVTNRWGDREDILNYIPGSRPNAIPALDLESGVSFGIGFNNLQGDGFLDPVTMNFSTQPQWDGDRDGDGIADGIDVDSDNDGIWDEYESGVADADGDLNPDIHDTDSNGDGVPDRADAALDSAGEAAIEGGMAYSHQFLILDNGLNLDFTGVGSNNTADLEYIDMVNGTAETVTLTEADVVSLTDADNSLMIFGDAGDTVNLAGFEATGSQRSVHGQLMDIYVLGDAEVLIEQDIGAVVI